MDREMYVGEFGPKESPCVVLLHGGGVSGWMWDRQIEDLKGDYYCLVPDLPGHGKSQGSKFSIKASAELVAELIKDKAGGKAHLVGHSLGAQIVVKLLASSPEVIERAIVCSALVRPLGLMSSLVKPTVKLTLPLARQRWFAKLQAQALSVPEEYFEQYYADSRSIAAETLEQVLSENAGFSLPPGLEYCTVPTLVLAGQKERKAIHDSARDLVATLPGSLGYLVQGAGHGLIFEQPELFSRIMLTYLSEQWHPPAQLKALK